MASGTCHARAKGVEFSLRYPAALKINVHAQMDSFQSPTDAEESIKSLLDPNVLLASAMDDGEQDGATSVKD